MQACDDGDPNTVNDMETILDCDGSICVPCMGTPVDCSNGSTTVQPCDDGDPCTVNDEETILDSDGTVCVPCAGTPAPCGTDDSCEINQPCDDGDPCTINDVEVVLASDGSICVPCMGTEVDDIEAVIDVTDESCPEDNNGSIVIDEVLGGQPPYVFAFNSETFSMESQYLNLAPGTYSLLIQDNNGCETQQDITINAASTLVLELGEDETINLGDSIQLTVSTAISIDTVEWGAEESLSCLGCLEPFASPTTSTTYTLTVVDENGCTVSDQITINVNRTRMVYIPSAFSPNDDGVNDRFLIYSGAGVRSVRSFAVYNKWGGELFSASDFQPNDIQFAWDGTFQGERQGPGVYVYYAEIEFVDGETEVVSGEVLLLR
jgi:gliding motility-associated-like protein